MSEPWRAAKRQSCADSPPARDVRRAKPYRVDPYFALPHVLRIAQRHRPATNGGQLPDSAVMPSILWSAGTESMCLRGSWIKRRGIHARLGMGYLTLANEHGCHVGRLGSVVIATNTTSVNDRTEPHSGQGAFTRRRAKSTARNATRENKSSGADLVPARTAQPPGASPRAR